MNIQDLRIIINSNFIVPDNMHCLTNDLLCSILKEYEDIWSFLAIILVIDNYLRIK